MHPPPAHLQAKWPADMLVISFLDAVTMLVSFFAFFLAGAFAQTQTAVTLWQFGQGRLLEAHVTLPLEAMGTVSDGSATTYLYQALNDNLLTTTNAAGSFTTQTIAKPTPRTIVASASGWVELGLGISCGLVNSTFGECFLGTNTVPANTGKPTPEAILIGDPTTLPPVPSASASTSSQSAAQGANRALAGGLVAVFLAMFLGFGIFIFLRRRRGRQREELENTAARGFDPSDNNDWNPNSGNMNQHLPSAVFAAGPQLELGLTRDYSDISGSDISGSGISGRSQTQLQVGSELPTEDLVRILAERVQNNELRGPEPPPAYPATPRFLPLRRGSDKTG
ncbi:hypothetical protein K438DRAFT_1937589 [Mycena galopus ATCC 62051]|nr:hypothetical protein K438DRAFT_1937589 [Mycena galopus ATCC 62051]